MTTGTQSYWRRLRGLNHNAKLYLAGTFFRATSFGIWSLLFNLYLASMGFDAAFIGLANALVSAASMVCSLPAGLLADRIGCKWAMVIGLVGMTISRFGTATFSQRWLVAAFNTLFGVAAPLLLTSVAPFLMENAAPRDRALLFTADAGLMNLAMFVAATAGGYLPWLFAGALGVGEESAPAYRGAMLTAAVVIALALAPTLGLKDRPKPPRARPAASPIFGLGQRFSNPRLVARLAIPRVVVAFGAGLVFPFLNLFYKERFGISDAALGWVFGITNVIAAAMMLGGGIVAERLGKIRALLIARGLSTPLLLIIGFVPSLPIVVAAHWVRSGLMRLGGPLYMAFVMEQLEERERATGSSLLGMSWDIGWSTASYVGGLVQVQSGFGPLFVACAAFYASSLVCVYRFFGSKRVAEGRS